MNARSSIPPQSTATAAASSLQEQNEAIDLVEQWDIILDHRWSVVAIIAFAIAVGVAYAFMARPVYESNLLIQVEDYSDSAKSPIGGDATSSVLLNLKSSATAEMEIIRSRFVIGKAVDSTLFFIEARPRYLPVIGNWLARRSHTLSNPGFLGFGGFVSGSEKITVGAFDVPAVLEGSRFSVVALGDGRYELSHPKLSERVTGVVGSPLVRDTPFGHLSLLITALDGKPGAQFHLTRYSRLTTITGLQANLKLSEKGRQSGIIDATLQSSDSRQLALILNEIGHQYVRQNVERRAAEAQKMLAFLGIQMPQFKKQLENAEDAFSRYRNQQGTINLDEESKVVLNRSVDLQSKLIDAEQKRLELTARFTTAHPAVKTLDEQIASWKREIAGLNAHIRTMPTVQQDALKLERDAKVAYEVYQSLRNNVIQLELVREGKVGNVRLIDDAVVPEWPVAPNQPLVIAMAAMAGLVAGVVSALARNALNRGIRDSQEIEAATGLNVYSTIPLSRQQPELAARAAEKRPGVHLLTAVSPSDVAVESLRSLRTALQFAMVEAPNNRVLITGATPGVGKSFVSSNFAAILASAGKRVLLVDADMRKGHLNSIFGLRREHGLSEVVAGTLQVIEGIHRDVLPNLDLLTTGVLPPNPAELMLSTAFIRVLEDLSAHYDLVLIDTPPVLAAADTLSIASQTGTLLLVARAGMSQIGELHEAAKRLAHVGRSINGVLFNAVDLTRRYYGSYGYKYGGYRYRQYSYETASGGVTVR
jgi:tyrosine-protein kinase Etk/Wzc